MYQNVTAPAPIGAYGENMPIKALLWRYLTASQGITELRLL